MKSRILLLITASLITIALTGCESDTEGEETASTVSVTSANSDPVESKIEGISSDPENSSMSPLESVRKEYGRTPDMHYYTYYIGTRPEPIEDTPW